MRLWIVGLMLLVTTQIGVAAPSSNNGHDITESPKERAEHDKRFLMTQTLAIAMIDEMLTRPKTDQREDRAYLVKRVKLRKGWQGATLIFVTYRGEKRTMDYMVRPGNVKPFFGAAHLHNRVLIHFHRQPVGDGDEISDYMRLVPFGH